MNAVKGMQSAPEQSPVAQKRKLRDPRLDVFRGLGMFIILIAHIPENNLASWIPARFGYSDAADLFVFCSGMASAFAFASLFEKRGWRDRLQSTHGRMSYICAPLSIRALCSHL